MSDSVTPVGLAVPTRKPAPAAVAEEPKDKTHTPSQRSYQREEDPTEYETPIETTIKIEATWCSCLSKKLY
jgi:hypothetical protein